MKINQEQVALFNDMILEAIIYGRSCEAESNKQEYADDKDLCASVKLFLHSIGIENVNYKQDGYINLANGGNPKKDNTVLNSEKKKCND